MEQDSIDKNNESPMTARKALGFIIMVSASGAFLFTIQHSIFLEAVGFSLKNHLIMVVLFFISGFIAGYFGNQKNKKQ